MALAPVARRLVLASCLAALPLPAQDAPATTFDLSGAEAFWRVYDVLARDAEPADSLWEALWRTPGYALLDLKERRRATLTRAIRLAVRPSLRDSASAAAAGGGWPGWVTAHLRDVGPARDSLAAFERSLQSDALVREARALARAYLPEGAMDRSPGPPVSFIYFHNARGYPERILLDPLHFMRMTNRAEVLGHELHHHYRARVARPLRDFGDDMLAWTLSTVESEGIAGMIDKRRVPALDSGALRARYPDATDRRYFETYQAEFARSAERLRQAEDVLERVGRHPDSSAVLGRWLNRELPDNGRIMGAFMAETIERELGRRRLVEVVGDPFAFWRLYREAALRTGGRAYAPSERALRTIAETERRYVAR